MRINQEKKMIRMKKVAKKMRKGERAVGLSMIMMAGSTSAASA
jgi:hypothetical protein